MSTQNNEELQRLIAEMALLIDKNDEPDPQLYAVFFERPEYAFHLIELLNNLDEDIVQEGPPVYSACVFAFDICVAQLQAATERQNKAIAKSLIQLMNRLAVLINTKKHSLSYWLPVLNAFYEVHADLTQELKDAYFNLASDEGELDDGVEELSHLDSIRNLIQELSHLSVFDIAEHFFAQSYAMPADFFSDLIVDLYSISEGQDIALLTLLHPGAAVRQTVIESLDQLIHEVTLSSVSLSRLQTIKYWYPQSFHATFDRWLKIQRKKGVVFAPEPVPSLIGVKATEVDGSGCQGIFIRLRQNRKNRLAGLLLKYAHGIKDCWITPFIPAAEVSEYYQQAFDENVTLRNVDTEYFQLMLEHFLAISIQREEIPGLYFLALQEALGLRLRPQELDLDALFDKMSIEISPFTQDAVDASLKRSKSWLTKKQFTESWYLENPVVDKIVNHNSSFIDGVKVCRLEDAIDAVSSEELELHRDKWMFHFLWTALWIKAKRNEKAWQDSFFIAHMIRDGHALKEIPIMKEICRQTVINSVETMQERRTHLNKE